MITYFIRCQHGTVDGNSEKLVEEMFMLNLARDSFLNDETYLGKIQHRTPETFLLAFRM